MGDLKHRQVLAAAFVCAFVPLCLCVLTITGSAQTQEQIHQEALDALYNLDFTTAEARLRSLTQSNPGDPTYWNHLASSMWLKIVAGQEKLNLESFSGAALGTEDSSDKINPQQEKLLR